MAILRSRDGRFYDIPDDELQNMEVPAERLKEVLSEMGPDAEQGGVEPYGRRRWHWRNHWSNCWRNCWRNCY